MMSFSERHESIDAEQQSIRDSDCVRGEDGMHEWIDVTEMQHLGYRYRCALCDKQYKTNATFGAGIW